MSDSILLLRRVVRRCQAGRLADPLLPSPRVLSVALLLLVALPAGCGSGDDPPWSGPVADPVDAPVHPEARFLPGIFAVTDARHDGGHWWLLDHRNGRVVSLDDDLQPVHSFGRRGDGPGELRVPGALLLLDGGVAVLDNPVRPRIVAFDAEGEPRSETVIHFEDCDRLQLVDARESQGGVDFLAQCVDISAFREPGRLLPHFLMGLWRWDPAGDSLARPVWTRRRGVRAGFAMDDEPIGAVGPLHSWVGTAGDPCLDPVAVHDDQAPSRLCFPDLPRIPVPEDRREELERTVERLPLRTGGLIRVPELQPALDRVSVVEGGVAIHGISGEDARTLRVLRADGTVRELGEPVPLDTFVDRDRVLMTWQVGEGTMVRQVPIP